MAAVHCSPRLAPNAPLRWCACPQIEQARLLTLNAAHLMDTVGNKAARSQISQIKIVAPRVAERVIDRAMQAHGAMGLSQDTPMAHFWVRYLVA